MMNNKAKLVGGGFMTKEARNNNLLAYSLKHPKMSHAKLAKVFKLSRRRVGQILAREAERFLTEGGKLE